MESKCLICCNISTVPNIKVNIKGAKHELCHLSHFNIELRTVVWLCIIWVFYLFLSPRFEPSADGKHCGEEHFQIHMTFEPFTLAAIAGLSLPFSLVQFMDLSFMWREKRLCHQEIERDRGGSGGKCQLGIQNWKPAISDKDRKVGWAGLWATGEVCRKMRRKRNQRGGQEWSVGLGQKRR